MRARKKEREGDFIQVEIAPSTYAYCRYVYPAEFMFYDFLSSAPLVDISVLVDKSFILGIGVMLYATREGRWKIIATSALPPEVKELSTQSGFVREGVNSPMTAEHALREAFKVKGFECLNPNFPWQGGEYEPTGKQA
jgi:hypothetical protein